VPAEGCRRREADGLFIGICLLRDDERLLAEFCMYWCIRWLAILWARNQSGFVAIRVLLYRTACDEGPTNVCGELVTAELESSRSACAAQAYARRRVIRLPIMAACGRRRRRGT